MAFTNVVKGVIEAWWADVSSLVNATDSSGNPALGPVRAQVTANFPVTGSIQKSTAGAAAPDQTLQTFSSSGGTSIVSGATVALFTVPAGKTFYITDIVVTGQATTATQWLAQVKAGATVIFEGYVKTDTVPIDTPGMETQPSAPAGSAVTLVFPAATGTFAAYYVAGYVQ